MSAPHAEHMSKPWRVHEFTQDFELDDVMVLPTPGGPDDFPKLVQLASSFDPDDSPSLLVRSLFAVRWKIGALFGWDDHATGVGKRVTSLRERLPDDLREGPTGPTLGKTPFSPLYLLDDEWALEVANATMHGVAHFSWVPDGKGGYHGQIAIYIKHNGLFGAAYLMAIKPFRMLMYPAIKRIVARHWDTFPYEAPGAADAVAP